MASITTKWILELVDRVSKPLRAINNASKRAETATNRVKGSLDRLKSTALATFGALAIFRGITWISKLGLDAEQTDVKFGVLLGSTQKAAKMLKDINEFANATPFENADLKKSAELLLNFGISGNKIIPTLKLLGNVSGGNKDKLNALTLAYAQSQSAGKLMGQDLLQMINAGFNPLEIMAQKTGKSIGFFKDQMSKGKLGSGFVTEALKIATGEGGRFNGMLEKISQTGTGKLSTFFGNLKTNLAEFSKIYITPLIKNIADFGNAFIENFGKLKESIFNLIKPLQPLWVALSTLLGLMFGLSDEGLTAGSAIDTLSSIINAVAVPIEILTLGITQLLTWLQPLAPVLEILAIGYAVWTAAQWALNIAMTANPIGLIVLAIAALIGGVIYAYQKIGWFRGAIDAAWVTIKGFGTAIKELVVDRIKEMIKGIVGIGKTLMLFFKGEWKKAWETGKQATKDLLGVGTAKKAADKFKDIGKNAAEAYRKGVDTVKAAEFKTKTKAVEVPGTENSLGGTPPGKIIPEDPAIDPLSLGAATGGNATGRSGSGGGKSITQNLNITNHFNVDKNARESMEDLADILAGRMNDKLRDGLIALQ